MRFAYVILSYIATPIVLLLLIYRSLMNRAYLDRLEERFGFGAYRGTQPGIWVHAVSVGEVQAAAPLIRQLLLRYPESPLVVTTVTPTGASRVAALFGDEVHHSYVPYDLPGAVKRFFDRVTPKVAIILETELWPNLYHECGRWGVPLVLASARISPHSLGRYRRLIGLFKEALSHGIVIAAQSETDAERFRSIGANPRRTHVTGNIKFDIEIPPGLSGEAEDFRRLIGTDRPVWVAASTHEGEEAMALEAHRAVVEKLPDCLLILVPRHPERFGRVAELLRRGGWRYARRSLSPVCDDRCQVFLADTLGELLMFYAAADMAFVGGSLVPIGGHNLLEPAALGKATVTGPNNFNAEDIAELFIRDGAVRTVRSVAELAGVVSDLLNAPERREQMGRLARATLQQNRGALERLLALLCPLLDEP